MDLFKKNVLIKVARKPYRKNEMYLDSEFHSLHSPCYKSNPKIPWYYYNLHLHDNRVRSSSIHEYLYKLVAQAIKDWIHFHFLINDFPFSHISTFVGIPNQLILWKIFYQIHHTTENVCKIFYKEILILRIKYTGFTFPKKTMHITESEYRRKMSGKNFSW